MGEPIYDEDLVNLGFLKRKVSETEENINIEYGNVNRHYGSKPKPPYSIGDTWIDGSIVYTCINSREIGVYDDDDWVTESGAKAEAEKKNKTYLTQPSNYDIGDMWILQSDTDHEAGKKGEILITTVKRSTYNAADWVTPLSYGSLEDIEGVSEKLEETIKEVDVVVERTVTITTNLGEVSQRVTDTEKRLDEEIVVAIAEQQQTIDGLTEKIINNGGNNLFYYSIDFWESVHLEEFYNTEFITNTKSGYGYLVNAGNSKQTVQVQNGIHTVSFKYKKLANELANCSVKINGEEYPLTETNWTNFKQTINVNANYIDVEFISDTDNVLYVADLLGNSGSEADVWTQNPNETRTDTVKIGKGIQVDSSAKNTYHRIDADGNRTYNKATGKVVNEATDKGSEMEELVVRGQAKISGTLWQQVGNQTWISSLL